MLMDVVKGIFENADRIVAFVAACAVLYTANVSRNAIRKWRDEKRFDRRFEYAIKLLKLVYNVRRNIDSIRFKMVSEEDIVEAKSILRKKGISDTLIEENGDLVIAQRTLNRLKIFSKNRDKIRNIMPEAQAVFGEEVKNALDELWGFYFSIEAKADRILESESNVNENNSVSLLIDRKVDEPDELEINVNKQIKIIERECRPIVDPDRQEHGIILFCKKNFIGA